jgi:CubicO group peptidase (beta-lactamase class C family)
MKPLFQTLIFCLLLQPAIAQTGSKAKKATEPARYFPGYGSWQVKDPASMGIEAARLKEAVDFAIASEAKNPRSMEENHYRTFGKEPFGEGNGPFADRGDPTGLIIYKGYVVAQWGDPNRCDMTHSVTKSFLATTVGLALDRGLIRSVADTVAPYVPPIELYTHGEVRRPAEDFGKPMLLYPFASAHNKTITWNDMLRQTSDWEGTLWGKPDWADRPDADASKWLNRPRAKAGSTYEYNDVRVNALALAATMVWRQPLPQVLKVNIMDKIGASNTWRWTGYRNAWIVLDGQAVQSVSGGGHWGGGMFINAWDMARFGLFTMHKGNWNGQQLLSESFFEMATTPTTPKPDYGFMNFFLNTDKKYMPDAPASAYCHIGNGTNMIYVDPENDVVAVVRWFDSKQQNEIVKRILAALPAKRP